MLRFNSVFFVFIHELKFLCFIKNLIFLKVSLRKICENTGFLWPIYFLYKERLYDSVLIREDTGQIKPVFWHILHSVFFIIWKIIQKKGKKERTRNKFTTDWQEVTQSHEDFIQKNAKYFGHLVRTLGIKTGYCTY